MEFVVLRPSHKLAQIFTNYLWAKWSVSQYFYIPLPISVPKNLSCHDNQYTTSPHQKTATLIFVGEAGGPRSIPQNGIPKSYQDGLYNCSLDKTEISKYVKDNYVINGTFFQKYWRKSGNRHYSGPTKNIPKSLIKLLK